MTFDIVQSGTVLLSPREGVTVRFMLPVGITLSQEGIIASASFTQRQQEIEVSSVAEGMNVHAIRGTETAQHKKEDGYFHFDEDSGVVIPLAHGNLCLVPRNRKNK